MISLAHSQQLTMLALERGPQFLDIETFRGPAARIIAGMKVHANTISHGRLVALEETFPRTRRLLGETSFNLLSRRFLENRPMPWGSLARIGAGFPRFLEQAAAGEAAADMARFEWLWLQSYHAADADPLNLADLAGIPPEGIVAMQIVSHPAARIERFGRALRRELAREAPVLEQAHAILITRPGGEVLVHPATRDMLSLLSLARAPIAIGNLFSALTEPGCSGCSTSDDLMAPFLSLLQAGAFVLVQADLEEKELA
ncbi:MAG: hypothetical protein KatS3mg120_0824 [Erythrobacter sp.]|nr:MAG: hypothetical protein KatS3mg120_0824 [Erythrobacter sp.]